MKIQTILVDIIGYPGSGKTFLASRLNASSQMRVISTSVDNGAQKSTLFKKIINILSAPLFFFYLLAFIITRKDWGLYNIRKIYAVQKVLLEVSKYRTQDGVVLIDEGPFNRLFTASFGTKQTKLSDIFMKKLIRVILFRINYILLVDIDCDICIRQFTNRVSPLSRFSKDSSQEIIDMLKKDDFYPNLISILSRSGRLMRVSVDLDRLENGDFLFRSVQAESKLRS